MEINLKVEINYDYFDRNYIMQYRKLSELTKLEDNPRFIKDGAFQILCDSIKKNPKFFEARPLILSNRTGKLIIIAGNSRYEAARALNLQEAPTYLIEGITEEKEREITIRDNTQQGSWDMDLLSGWDSLPLTEWGVNLPKAWMESEPGEGAKNKVEKEITCPKCGHIFGS